MQLLLTFMNSVCCSLLIILPKKACSQCSCRNAPISFCVCLSCNFAQIRTKIMCTLLEDLHAFLHTEVTWKPHGGIPSQSGIRHPTYTNFIDPRSPFTEVMFWQNKQPSVTTYATSNRELMNWKFGHNNSEHARIIIIVWIHFLTC
jgi:hypothetical protein